MSPFSEGGSPSENTDIKREEEDLERLETRYRTEDMSPKEEEALVAEIRKRKEALIPKGWVPKPPKRQGASRTSARMKK